MKTMFVYAVLALGWASSAWPQGFSSYVPRHIAQPFAPTSDETCKTLQLHPHRSPRPVVSPDAVLGHQDTMTRPRASRALGDCA
jgi:hypothetical protein